MIEGLRILIFSHAFLKRLWLSVVLSPDAIHFVMRRPEASQHNQTSNHISAF